MRFEIGGTNMDENNKMPAVVLITGASAGIGSALAREYARRGNDLVLVARRKDRLEALAEELHSTHGVNCHCIGMDLSTPEAPAAIESELKQRQLEVEVLVNNAGYGVPGAYLSQPWQVHQGFLQIMVTTVAELGWRLVGPMRDRGHGRIINISSVAGHMPGTAGHTLYGAVKSWMIRFSESLSLEMEKHGVSVTAICPGFTLSEFHDVTGTREQVSRMPAYMWMTAEEVARQAVEAAERGDRVFINGRVNRFIAWMARYLPRGVVYRVLSRQSKHFRNASDNRH
jgi:short-subunit dehydrogenase